MKGRVAKKILAEWVLGRLMGDGEIRDKGGVKEMAGKKEKKRIYDYERYSVRVVVVSDTRHVAYYHRYAAQGPRDRSLIQLWYTAIIALQPRLPSVIPVDVPWQLMNKANSGVMSPFRNALSKVFDGLCLSPSLSLCLLPPPSHAAATRSFNNGLSKCIAVRHTGWPRDMMAERFSTHLFHQFFSNIQDISTIDKIYYCRQSGLYREHEEKLSTMAFYVKILESTWPMGLQLSNVLCGC